MEVVCHADRGEVFPPLTPNIVVILCTMFASLCSILLKGTATLIQFFFQPSYAWSVGFEPGPQRLVASVLSPLLPMSIL